MSWWGYLRVAALVAATWSPVANADHLIATPVAHALSSISGDRALDTASTLDGLWRHAGNEPYDLALDHLVDKLRAAGFVPREQTKDGHRLSFHIVEEPMLTPTWEPLYARLELVGETAPLMTLDTNPNMIAINAYSTRATGIEAEVVNLDAHADAATLDIRDKIVFSERHPWRLTEWVSRRGAVGVLAYAVPDLNRPDEFEHSVVHHPSGHDPVRRPWALLLSRHARDRLREALDVGPVTVRALVSTKRERRPSRSLIAEIHGHEAAEERFVLSAHLQEPGANDDASRIALLAEIARGTAELPSGGNFKPARTLAFLWGDEFRAVEAYLRADPSRAAGVIAGLSLDMVGADTALTGGRFLIERMPDPAAIWMRGNDRPSGWGGEKLRVDDMRPHYLNDVTRRVCDQVAQHTGWRVDSNPYEGGSDHEAFLHQGHAAVLFWHFPDPFYHSDLDRADKLSAKTLHNVGSCAMALAIVLTTADAQSAVGLVHIVLGAARSRLQVELDLGLKELNTGQSLGRQTQILDTWADWYLAALGEFSKLDINRHSPGLQDTVDAAKDAANSQRDAAILRLHTQAN